MSTPKARICGTQMSATPRRNIICDLPAGHPGWHSAPDYGAMTPDVLAAAPRVDWSNDDTAEAKLARIATLCDKARAQAGVTTVPIRIPVQDVLVILRGQDL